MALCGLIFSEVYTGLGYAEPFSQLLPNSRDAINRVSGDVIPRFGLLLLAFWVYQVAWLNRQQRIDGLIAATPVPSALLLSSQFVVLYGLILLLVVLSLAAVALAQVLLQVPLDLLEYGQQGLLLVLPLWVWATLLLACHALLRQPLWANLAVAGLLAFGLSPLPSMLQLQHPLWRIGQSQLALPDSLWGYQGALGNTAQTFAGDSQQRRLLALSAAMGFIGAQPVCAGLTVLSSRHRFQQQGVCDQTDAADRRCRFMRRADANARLVCASTTRPGRRAANPRRAPGETGRL